ncbi:MAG: response regulator [Verrucomicrobiia bacterium]
MARPQRTLLLVEDDPFIRPLLIQILNRANYEVFAAEDGNQGLDLFRNERARIHGAVIDIVLPDMEGTEIFAHIRQQNPHLPVVLISGFSTAPRLRLDGTARFLQKPFNPQELLGALDQLFT